MPLDLICIRNLVNCDIKKMLCPSSVNCCNTSAVKVVVSDNTFEGDATINPQIENIQDIRTKVQKIYYNDEEIKEREDEIQQGIINFKNSCIEQLKPRGKKSKENVKNKEGLKRFEFACQLSKVDFEEKGNSFKPLLEKEQKKILKNIKKIQEYGSLAAYLCALYSRINPQSDQELKRLKEEGAISSQVYEAFKDLMKKNSKITSVEKFAVLNFKEKKRLFKTAEKIKELTKRKFWPPSIKEVLKSDNKFIFWTIKVPDRLFSDQIRSRENLISKVKKNKLKEEKVSEKKPTCDDYIYQLVDEKKDDKFYDLGKIKLRVLATYLEIDYESIQEGTLTDEQRVLLKTNIDFINELNGVMFHLFKTFKETEKLEDEEKTKALKERLNEEKFEIFLKRTGTRRRPFFQNIKKTTILKELPCETLCDLYHIALHYNGEERSLCSDQDAEYPLINWMKTII